MVHPVSSVLFKCNSGRQFINFLDV
uniref:Uncharacterized protein n=1 Tax=Anguilla anguilla TaxID=7936 RepID=A0A0E9QB91_ANGAN